MIEYLLPGLVILVLVALNGLFVAAEFAILAAPRTRVERAASKGNVAARRVHLVQQDQPHMDLYIAVAQVGITLTSLGIGMYGESHLAHWLLPAFEGLGKLQLAAAHSAASTVSIVLLTYLHIVVGEMVPKSLALAYPVRTAIYLIYPMTWALWLTLGLPGLLNKLGNLLLRLLRVPIEEESAHIHTPEEIELIVEESQETGAIGEQESGILLNLLHFSDIQVRKVMVPRTKVIGVDVDLPLMEAVAVAVQSRHTRYPVYADNLDHIVGILHVKELYRELRENPESPSLHRAYRKPVFVPEQMTVEDLLMEFRRNKSQIAVAIDEYGGTSGIVSLEDVLEEIFGEVQDEFDEEEPEVRLVEPGRALLAGTARLDTIYEQLEMDLQRPDVDTVGGLVQAELGRLARAGDEISSGGVTFTVLSVDGLAVSRVEARWEPPEERPEIPGI